MTQHPRTRLSVNVNKLATLRNSRGKNNPDVLKTSLDLISLGAEGITVHPRPDERHIRRSDVYALRPAVKARGVEFNIEGYPSEDFLKMVEEVAPEQCTLVPDPPDALTSNAGWKVLANKALLKSTIERLHKKQIRVSVFVDPRTATDSDFDYMKEINVDRIELYTEEFAETFGTPKQKEVIAAYFECAEKARVRGIGVNAGHDLTTENLNALVMAIPYIEEVSIGHALIADALYWGFKATIEKYLQCLKS